MWHADSACKKFRTDRFISITISVLLAILLGANSVVGAAIQAQKAKPPGEHSALSQNDSINERLLGFIAGLRYGGDINAASFERHTGMRPIYSGHGGKMIRYGQNLKDGWAYIFTLNLGEKLIENEFNTLRVAITKTTGPVGIKEGLCKLKLVDLAEQLTDLGYKRVGGQYRGGAGIKARFDKNSLQIRTVSQYLGKGEPCVLGITITGELGND
jgi:hypothetical protein